MRVTLRLLALFLVLAVCQLDVGGAFSTLFSPMWNFNGTAAIPLAQRNALDRYRTRCFPLCCPYSLVYTFAHLYLYIYLSLTHTAA
jgi:hypothetical protein